MHRRLPLVSTATCRIPFPYIKSACLPIKFGSLALGVDSITIPPNTLHGRPAADDKERPE